MKKRTFILISLLLALSLLCGCAELFDANTVIERDPFIPEKGTPVPEPNAPLLKSPKPIVIPEISETPVPVTSTNPKPVPTNQPTEAPVPSATPTAAPTSTPQPEKTPVPSAAPTSAPTATPLPEKTQEPTPVPTLIPPVVEIIPKIGMLSDNSDNMAYAFSTMAWREIQKASVDFGFEPVLLEIPSMDEGTILAHINKLVQSECELIVLPNNKFKEALKKAQEIFPDIYFILIEFNGVMGSNVVTASFSEFQAGFLAAVTAAVELSTSLDRQSVEFGIIIEEDNLSAQMYTSGFAEGLVFASNQYGIKSVLNQQFIVFLKGPGDPDAALYAAYNLYDSGVNCILNLAGSSYSEVIRGAIEFTGYGSRCYVIGVDYDSYKEGLYGAIESVVLTSAVKFYDKAVYYLIQQFAEGIFPGGSSVMFDLALGGIGLPPSNPGLSAGTLSILEEINRFIKNNELIIPALGEFPVVTPVPIPSLLPTP